MDESLSRGIYEIKLNEKYSFVVSDVRRRII